MLGLHTSAAVGHQLGTRGRELAQVGADRGDQVGGCIPVDGTPGGADLVDDELLAVALRSRLGQLDDLRAGALQALEQGLALRAAGMGDDEPDGVVAGLGERHESGAKLLVRVLSGPYDDDPGFAEQRGRRQLEQLGGGQVGCSHVVDTRRIAAVDRSVDRTLHGACDEELLVADDERHTGHRPRMARRTHHLTAHATTARPVPVAASIARPPAPVGQARPAPGSAEPLRATSTSHAAGNPASHASAEASAGSGAATRAQAMPARVAGATAGAANRLARTAYGVSWPNVATITGVQASWAAAGTATAAASGCGIVRPSRAVHAGATVTIAAVASTDIAKPGDRARNGSMTTRASTAADTAGRARPRRPVTPASSTTRPITAARSTLGDGRTRTTNPSSDAPQINARPCRPSPVHRTAESTVPSRIAMFAPLTAVRWASPVTRNAEVNDSGICETSPSTSPGTSPRSSPGSGRQAARRPSRTEPAARCHIGGRPTNRGAPGATSTAATASPALGGASRPGLTSRWPGSSPSHCESIAKPTTGARSDRHAPPGRRMASIV